MKLIRVGVDLAKNVFQVYGSRLAGQHHPGYSCGPVSDDGGTGAEGGVRCTPEGHPAGGGAASCWAGGTGGRAGTLKRERMRIIVAITRFLSTMLRAV